MSESLSDSPSNVAEQANIPPAAVEPPAAEAPSASEPGKKAPARRAAAKKTTPAKTVAENATPAKKAPARKTAAKKASGAAVADTAAPASPAVETPAVETPAVETPVVETPVVETAAAEAPAAKAAARKAPARKTAAKKAPAKKAPAKRAASKAQPPVAAVVPSETAQATDAPIEADVSPAQDITPPQDVTPVTVAPVKKVAAAGTIEKPTVRANLADDVTEPATEPAGDAAAPAADTAPPASDDQATETTEPAATSDQPAATEPAVPGFAELAKENYVSLTTFRKSGTPVPTPIWSAPAGDKLLVWTGANSGKMKRLRHTERVTLAPCDRQGRLLGEPVPATARILTAEDMPRVKAAMTAKYGWQFTVSAIGATVGRFLRIRPHGQAGLELTLD